MEKKKRNRKNKNVQEIKRKKIKHDKKYKIMENFGVI